MEKPVAWRLFLALWPDAATRDAIGAWQQLWEWPARASPVRAERLHLTLHFLGDVPVQRIDELRRALARPFEPFKLRFGYGEVWPHGIAVLRPEVCPSELLRLQAGAKVGLDALGIHVEDRPFKAHVTVARRASSAVPPAHTADFQWRVDSRAGYVLVRSLPGGSGYEEVHHFSAGAALD